MNDGESEKEFSFQKYVLNEKRDLANKNLPKLSLLLDLNGDKELYYFVQEIVDNYMLNVCQLGRRPGIKK